MSKDNITDYGKSIRSKLLNIAKKPGDWYLCQLNSSLPIR